MKEFLQIILALILIILVGLLLAFPVMWLWNWLIPSIFTLREIVFWEAWGLMILTGFLFRTGGTVKSK